jgi:hypothetical protein
MKFGKTLRETVKARMPAWADYMLQYKALKQLLNQLVEAHTAAADPGHGAYVLRCAERGSWRRAGARAGVDSRSALAA